MEAPASSFSGHSYGDGKNSTSGSNTVTHYKAGKKKPGKSKNKTPKQKNGKQDAGHRSNFKTAEEQNDYLSAKEWEGIKKNGKSKRPTMGKPPVKKVSVTKPDKPSTTTSVFNMAGANKG